MLAIYFANLDWDKQAFRANIAAYTFVCVLLVLAMVYPTGLITPPVMGTALALTPAIAVGFLLGTWLLPRLDQQQFGTLVTLLITVSGLVLVATSALEMPMAMPDIGAG